MTIYKPFTQQDMQELYQQDDRRYSDEEMMTLALQYDQEAGDPFTPEERGDVPALPFSEEEWRLVQEAADLQGVKDIAQWMRDAVLTLARWEVQHRASSGLR